MAKKDNLPAEVHDHFRKANVLHGYVEDDLGKASKHALETGEELLAAKSSIPHGSWEDECERLFNGSPRTARFYMQFAKDMKAIPKRQNSAILMLEGSLDGAAKAARFAAKQVNPTPAKSTVAEVREPDETAAVDANLSEAKRKHPDGGPIGIACPSCGTDWWDENACGFCLDPLEETPGEDADSAGTPEESDSRPSRNDTETPAADFGKCPACAGTKWTEDEDGVSCAKCHHPYGEPAGDTDEDRLKTQRQKTVKTIEALMRAFDDLQTMLAKPEHGGTIQTCKALMVVAKGWK